MEKKNDLYNNPMVNAAKAALTPEQQDEYRKVGEYMYNSVNYRINEVGSQVKPSNQKDLVNYAVQAIKSGLDPMDLTDEETQALIVEFGNKWYEQFGLQFEDVNWPKVFVDTKKFKKKK